MTGDAAIVTGRRIADRYRLVSERADGSWDAVDETLKRNVVVCVLSSVADPEAKEHFSAEARALAGLNHRNVVATYDTGLDGDGSSYRVDELPGGHPLDTGAVDDDMRVSFATQIARALADAHSRDLVHGSLTSGDVLVNEEGRVKVRGLRLPDPQDAEKLKQADVNAVTNLVAALASQTASPLREMALGWRSTDPPSSVADMASALLTVPDDSDTTSLVDPHPTPTTGVPVPRRRSPWMIVSGVAAIAAAALLITVLLPNKGNNDAVSGPVRPLTVVAKSFDPEGNPPTENEVKAKLAVDGDLATNWSTELYKRDHFAGLKKGVGLIVQAQGAAEFHELHVRTPSRDWKFDVYVAPQPAATLQAWGTPVANGTATTDFTVNLGDAKGAAVLLWITDPAGTQVKIAELQVTGRA